MEKTHPDFFRLPTFPVAWASAARMLESDTAIASVVIEFRSASQKHRRCEVARGMFITWTETVGQNDEGIERKYHEVRRG